MMNIVGSKVVQWIAIALAVGTTLLLTIQWFQEEAKQEVIDQVRIETLENEIGITKDVEQAIREAQDSNPTRDGATALDRLRDREDTD